jgi:putative membrane protein insertion efficiency factor
MPPADMSAPQRVVLGLIRFYKLVFSPMYSGSCRFLPSCSDYAAEAVTRHGVVRGSALAARRLARCSPFGAHGLDPVPGGVASRDSNS